MQGSKKNIIESSKIPFNFFLWDRNDRCFLWLLRNLGSGVQVGRHQSNKAALPLVETLSLHGYGQYEQPNSQHISSAKYWQLSLLPLEWPYKNWGRNCSLAIFSSLFWRNKCCIFYLFIFLSNEGENNCSTDGVNVSLAVSLVFKIFVRLNLLSVYYSRVSFLLTIFWRKKKDCAIVVSHCRN